MHAARALMACGITLEAHGLLHRRTCTQAVHATAPGSRSSAPSIPFVVVRRCDTPVWASATLLPPAEGHPPQWNWKAKHVVPVICPGRTAVRPERRPPRSHPGNICDSVQIAWEAADDERCSSANHHAAAAPSPVDGARARGLLDRVYRTQPAGPEAAHARLEWTTAAQHPLFTVFVQLNCALSPPVTAASAFVDAVRAASRPRSPVDVPTWLAAVGAVAGTWRVEIEVRPPAGSTAISHPLFLHHLLRQTVAPPAAGPCLPRGQFVALYRRHLLHHPHGGGLLATMAWALLHSTCRRVGLPIQAHGPGYPIQPRPHDLVPRDFPYLNACAVTPKANGLEAFLVAHRHGYAALMRSGAVAFAAEWTAAAPPLYPLVLEGELVGGVFVAYDCLVSPALAYGQHGRFETRHAALSCAVRRLPPGLVVAKPFFPFELHPHAALNRCQAWAADSGIPCDGVIFVDAERPGYTQTERLWKLKHTPTVDMAVYACGSALPGHYELMLRGSPATVVQSLHRFRDAQQPCEYDLPVLLRPPEAIPDGAVVELGVTVRRDEAAQRATVDFPTMQVREAGKCPNFVIGCMDVVARGVSLEALRAPTCPVLPRLLLAGPVRRARVEFLTRCLDRTAPARVVDLGGGRGGDLAVWMHAGSVAIVDVVEPDADAVAEYRRRLVQTYGATPVVGGETSELHTPDGRAFRFAIATAREVRPSRLAAAAEPGQRPRTLVVCSFSVSQIVGCDADMDDLLALAFDGYGAVAVAISAHDHAAAPQLPDGTEGVSCSLVREPECPRRATGGGSPPCAPLRCVCAPDQRRRRYARLRTRIVGSTMADGIEESAFGLDVLRGAVAGPPNRPMDLMPPTPWPPAPDPDSPLPAAHWLVQSLVLAMIWAGGGD